MIPRFLSRPRHSNSPRHRHPHPPSPRHHSNHRITGRTPRPARGRVCAHSILPGWWELSLRPVLPLLSWPELVFCNRHKHFINGSEGIFGFTFVLLNLQARLQLWAHYHKHVFQSFLHLMSCTDIALQMLKMFLLASFLYS